MVRIKDIAEKVGMASSTVSAVLGDRKYCMVLKPSMLIYFLESDDSGEIYTTDALLPGNKIYGLTGGWGLSDGPFILPSWHNGNPNQLHFDGHVAKNIYGALAGSLTVQGSVYWRLGADISSLR